MSAIMTIVVWYAAGFFLADRLVLRGHSPIVWWTVAALFGALAVVPALVAVFWRWRTDARLDVIAIGSSDEGLHLAAMGRPESLAVAVGSFPSSLATRLGRVSLVVTVGHQAFNPVFETGERSAGASAVRGVRPLAEDDDRLVTCAGVDETVRAFEHVGVPDLVVAAVDERSHAARRQVARCIETSLRCAVPVLLAPVANARERRAQTTEVLTA